MKNILAENMLRFGPRNLSESEKNTLRILAEQSAEWDNVQASGTDPMSPKTVITDIPAETALTINGNQTTMNASPEGQGSIVDSTPYIGARMQAVYREKLTLQALAKMPSAANLSGRFGCSIEVFITPNQNGKYEAASILMFMINMYQNKDGKFIVYIQNQIDRNTKYAKLVNNFKVGTDTYPMKTSTPIIAKNLSTSMNNTYTKINTELTRLGFPALPNSIDLTTSVTL